MNRIGTSGWQYGHWLGKFYPLGTPARDMFEYYSRQFNTVELNTTFYRLPKEETVSNWRKTSPAGFIYSVKASRFITHIKRFLEPEKSLPPFFERISALKDRLGPVLFQTPPNFKANPDRLRQLLKSAPKGIRCAFEFRNASWLTNETFEILKKFNAALCIYDFRGFRSPFVATADFIYIRLHGPELIPYSGSYSEEDLAVFAQLIIDHNGQGREAYAYFDNDAQGYAPSNALALARMVKGA